MRTTIDIPDGMYRQIKARAAREGRSVKALILDAVTQALSTKRTTGGQRVTLPLIPSKRPGTIHLDNERIYDVISFP
jgi:plasmid stability protein